MTSAPAHSNFIQRLDEIHVLISLCSPADASIEETIKNLQRDKSLSRAAMVLLCSHVEGFFEELIGDVLQFHETNKTSVNALPLRLKTTQLWNIVGVSDTASDARKWAIIQALRKSVIADDGSQCDIGILNQELHTKGFANPGSNDVARLLSTVGVDDVWGMLEAAGLGLLKNSLDAIVGRRNPIAHGDANAAATPNDVEQYVKDMLTLASEISGITAQHLQSSSGVSDPWLLLI